MGLTQEVTKTIEIDKNTTRHTQFPKRAAKMTEARTVKFVETQTTAISPGWTSVLFVRMIFEAGFHERVNALICGACRWTLTLYAVCRSDKIDSFNNHSVSATVIAL